MEKSDPPDVILARTTFGDMVSRHAALVAADVRSPVGAVASPARSVAGYLHQAAAANLACEVVGLVAPEQVRVKLPMQLRRHVAPSRDL